MTKAEQILFDQMVQLLVMEGLEAGDEFYFEFGQDQRKVIEKFFDETMIAKAKAKAEEQLDEIQDEDDE